MTELLTEIKSRGYWRIVVRPQSFVEERLEYASLLDVIGSTSVRIRGWDFPHLGREDEIERQKDYVGTRVTWSSYREYWRFYRSGQFVYLGGIHTDWLDSSAWGEAPSGWKPGADLSVEDTVHRFTEVFELAKRLSLSEAGDDSMRVSVELYGLKGRKLTLGPSRAGFFDDRIADMDHFSLDDGFQREELVSDARELAQGWASEVFQRFGWTPDAGVLGSFQDELRKFFGG